MGRPPKSLLKDTHPELIEQLVDKSLAATLSTGSALRVEWECEHGHRWSAKVFNRTNPKHPTGCPVCCGKKVLVGFNDLATTDPDVAALLADSSLSATLTRSSNKKVEWCCDKGHVWQAPVSRLVTQGSRCPYCSGRLAVAGQTDFATAHPELVDELVDKTLASQVRPGSNRKARWHCPTCGYEYDMTFYDRGRGIGCPLCGGNVIVTGVNDLWTVAPSYAEMLVEPDVGYRVGKASEVPVSWRCYNDPSHVWVSTCSNRLRSDFTMGCPICDNKMVIPGINDLATTHPFLAAELVRAEDGRSVSAGSGRKLEWRCAKGHTWSTSPSHRVGPKGTGCPICSLAGTSYAEMAVADVVKQLVGESLVETNVTNLLPGHYEIDVLVRSKGLAIEFNGVRWHSEIGGRPRDYHLRKRRMCEELGLQLVQIWEDDWALRREIVVRMLASKLGVSSQLHDLFPSIDATYSERVFARKCEFVQVDGEMACAFLDENHIQGRVAATYYFGLMFDGRLVALMGVRSPRQNSRSRRRSGEWEIQRYATRGIVVGGFSKLLSHAERVMLANGDDLRSWISFSDCCVSDGSLYASCGFAVEHEMGPDYHYVGNLTKWHRVPKERFQCKTFRNRDDLVWDDTWTEVEAAHQNGLWRIWDAGKVKWVKTVSCDGVTDAVSASDVTVEMLTPSVDEDNDGTSSVVSDADIVATDVVVSKRAEVGPTRYSRGDIVTRLHGFFGEVDVEEVVLVGVSLFRIISRDLYVADMTDGAHGWHWFGEETSSTLSMACTTQNHVDSQLRDELRMRDAKFVAFWDERLWDMDLWLAMGAPDARDWERSYSWLSARPLAPVPLPAKRGTSQAFTTIAKHYQHNVIFARELAMWGDDVFLDRRRDKRRIAAALFANRYHYIGKLPDELTDAEILRGLRIAGYVNAYSRYDAAPLLSFLDTHSDVRRVIDPCAGWGERMLACASRGVAYDGVDINVALADGYRRMIAELGLANASFAVADGSQHDFEQADAMVTCPPYLDTEMYSEAGAEHLSTFEFAAWWDKIMARVEAAGVRYVCVTTNQACKDTFVRGVERYGFTLADSVEVGRGRASHFNRQGGVNHKREYEEFLMFTRA